jgi:arabinose-5-phosphate isomerase
VKRTVEQDNMAVLATACRVIAAEAQALAHLTEGISEGFTAAVGRIVRCRGKVVVSGVGKSGLVGRKITATLCSTGTPTVFLHPVEGMHGDVGIVAEGDILIALSQSGETEEVLRLAEYVRTLGASVFAMTGREASTLGRLADVVIPVNVRAEACPFDLIPTASTTALMALGDALAMCVMQQRGFGKEDFARLHPAGALGRRLTLRVGALMRRGEDLPTVEVGGTVRDALFVMTRARSGAVAVVSPTGQLEGFFTDGDLRRCLQGDVDLLGRGIASVMTKNPRTVGPMTLAADAARIMSHEGFDNLPVLEPTTGRVLGLIDERDLLALGLVD